MAQDETHCSHFDRNEISFRVTKCYVNTTPKQNHAKKPAIYKTTSTGIGDWSADNAENIGNAH